MVQNANASTDPEPTVVIIPGSFSPAYFYDKIVGQLRDNGIEAAAYDLPSASRTPPQPAATLTDDAAFFHDVAQKIADQGKDVVFVTHSYGGVVGTEASKGLTKAERKAAGKEGGLVRIVYVTSVVPPVGKSLADVMGDLVPAYLKVEVRSPPHLTTARLTRWTGRIHETRTARGERTVDVLGSAARSRDRLGQENAFALSPEFR